MCWKESRLYMASGDPSTKNAAGIMRLHPLHDTGHSILVNVVSYYYMYFRSRLCIGLPLTYIARC